MLARLIDFLLCRFASFITGVRPQAAIAEQSSEGIASILPIIIVMGILFYFGFHCLMK